MTKLKWEGLRPLWSDLERDGEDYTTMVGHTGGAAVILSSSETTMIHITAGIIDKLLSQGGPLAEAVMRDVCDLPDDAPRGYVEGLIVKYNRRISRKFGNLAKQLEVSNSLGLLTVDAEGRAPGTTRRYGTFRATDGAAQNVNSPGDRHEKQSSDAQRERPGSGNPQRLDPDDAQREQGQPSDARQPQPAETN